MTGSPPTVASDRLRVLMWVSVVLSVVLLVAITLLAAPLRTGATPLGIVSLQFAASPAAAERMLASWSAVPRARILWAHGLDFLLPVAYAAALGLAARRARRSARDVRDAATLASGAALAAALADQAENIAMTFTLLGPPTWSSVLATLVAATVKSTLLVVALGALATAIVADRRASEQR